MEPRRSSRPVIKPVKFWDFEKPDFSKTEQISYSISELTRTFVQSYSSSKPKKKSQVTGVNQEKLNPKNHISKKTVQSAKPRKHQKVKSQDDETKVLKKRNDETTTKSLQSTSNLDATPRPQEKSLARRKLVKDFKKKIKTHHSTLQTASNSTMCTVSVMNATDISRRSGRVRVKPLEFWNFEKIEVKNTDDGQVQVISRKQDIPDPRRRRLWEMNGTVTAPALPPPVPKRQSADPNEDASPRKRRKSRETIQENLKEKRAAKDTGNKEQEEKEDESGSEDNAQEEKREESKGKEGGRRGEETPREGSSELQVMKFKDLYFLHYLMNDCNCFLAKSFEDPRRGVFAGFIFLEGGSLLWQAKKDMFIKVVSGRGTLKMVNTETMEGIHMSLINKESATITTGTKVEIIKDRRCKMIKIYVEIKSTNFKRRND
ncbi:PH domain-containing protein DDB_G0287875-like isoform X2 [Penaeus monodon]|uniref:PH domain-containing protein DDB_G0287875-like isoform X2 n=1 Tax=Penaeus monodon TaxID=6687 RepID=UPI0018A77326|nr:PH domain-containing protein DDB_G0287875-like isoform X2 [Penaeus monodon]